MLDIKRLSQLLFVCFMTLNLGAYRFCAQEPGARRTLASTNSVSGVSDNTQELILSNLPLATLQPAMLCLSMA